MKNIIENNLKLVKTASINFKSKDINEKNNIIKELGQILLLNIDNIITENKKDLEILGVHNPLYDRLLLDAKRIESMANSCFELIEIGDPLSKFDNEELIANPSGINIRKVGVPLGVVACIYEARPNVTIDLTIMALKSGNAIVLKGSSSARFTNDYLINLIKKVLMDNSVDTNLVYQYPYEREYLQYLYNAQGLVDVIIPRGGKQLIQSVKKDSMIPIIETGAGVVHLYVDDIGSENLQKAISVIENAKISRPSVCNALDTLLIKKGQSLDFYIHLSETLKGVKINCLEKDYLFLSKYFEQLNIIQENNFHDEMLSLKLQIKLVDDIQQGIDHILQYSSLHSDGILSDNEINIFRFIQSVDSSVVYINSSTRFSDGGCFGLGGEIGISTQKLHARGPMGAEALVTYKYIVDSDWKCR
ncbi:MAG: glutamate-5-semialdehyde dehydrogenase [Candidatus Absconditabacteria bacterium]